MKPSTSSQFARKVRFGLAIDIITTQLGLDPDTARLDPEIRLASMMSEFDESSDRAAFVEQSGAGAVPDAGTGSASCRRASLPGDYAAAIEASVEGATAAMDVAVSHFGDGRISVLWRAFPAACCDPRLPMKDSSIRGAGSSSHAAPGLGGRIARRISRTAPHLVGAEIARIEGRELDASASTSRRSARPAQMALFTMRRSLTNWPRAFTRRVGSSRSRTCICGTPATAISVGEPSGRCGNSTRRIQTSDRKSSLPGPTSTIGAPVEHLDLATVIKVSQAVSGEIVLENLIDTLMRTAMEQAGAERALLIMPRGQEPRIEAEATTSGDTVTVRLVDEAVTERVLPESVLHYVLRTRESVILDDAAAQSPFGVDSYIRQRQARSILCLPLLNQAKLIGVLYLENNLTPRVFAPARISVLKLLASQAAIALENAHLYRDVAERETKIRRLVDSNIIGIFIWDFDGRVLEANDEFLHMVGYDREDLVAGSIWWTDLTPPDWRDRNNARIEQQKS